MENQLAETLSADEQAFFESGGEATITAETPEQTENVEKAVEQGQPPVTEQETAEQTRDEKGRFVPHQALHAEREEHKRTKATLEEIRQKQAVLEDRWNTLLTASKTPEQEQVPPPDPNVDIFAYSKWQGERMDALEARLKEQSEAESKAREANTADQAAWTHWQSAAAQFAAQTPDFGDAANYLSELRTRQLAAFGLSPEQVNATINQELRGVIDHAMKSGTSPAQMIYDYAKVSGFKPKATGELPPELKRVQTAQEQARTVGQASGRSGGDEMTIEKLLELPDNEFAAWTEKNAAQYRKMLGS